jgi:hypothetical protein
MLEAPGIEFRHEVGLIAQDGFLGFAVRPVAIDVYSRQGRGNRRSRDSRRSDAGGAVDETEAHGIAQIQLFIETVI